ncbi:MAG: GTPase Era [Spirochaetaceae bacterium]|jgi:GTP-binding protein Era|nr:GTPase Era [Spirochaetaceae bacterium]
MQVAVVAIVGRPSSGKSTLLNTICGEPVSIVSKVPQTTRNSIRGILSRKDAEGELVGQIIFIDTPGLHLSEKKLNLKLRETSLKALEDADSILYLIDATRPAGAEEEAIQAILAPYKAAGKVVTAINKIDRLKNSEAVDKAKMVPGTFSGTFFEGVTLFSISALKNEGVAALVDYLFSIAPEGEALYPDDMYTDQNIPFRIAEVIRGEAVQRLHEELPHSIYVEVADTELKANTLWVRAFIMCERESQKGMIVGKGGLLIKTIRIAAEKKLNQIFDWKVSLDLRVKTAPNWRQKDRVLNKFV